MRSRYYDPALSRFISADTTDVLTATPMALTDKNLFAYCDNNPVMREDTGGQFWNFVIGGVVGAVVGGVTAALNGGDSKNVIIGIVTGAASGVVAASGLGVVAQAGISAGISASGNLAEQVCTNGFRNINGADVIGSALVGGTTSLLGSAAGKAIGGNLEKAGTALLNKGKDKLLTGIVRKTMGQSHSSLIKQGTKYVTQATKNINTYRGISSSIGSLIGGATSSGYNALKQSLWR